MLVPALQWMRGYQSSWLRADIVAGLTAGAIVIPKAMAYATIADIPLQAGLYTAFLPMIVYALLVAVVGVWLLRFAGWFGGPVPVQSFFSTR